VKSLIVTADDVGIHRGMTLGAVRAHRDGIVTACSVAGAGLELAHAAALLRDCPTLDTGVHLMLTGGRPVSAPARIPSLLTRTGSFPSGYPAFLARYALQRIASPEVAIELRAQIERVIASGIAVTHLNGHQHLHVLPDIFDVVVALAVEFDVPYVRIPRDRGGDAGWIRRRSVALLSRVAAAAAVKARAAGLLVNDAAIGVESAGHLSTPQIHRLLSHVDGLTELVVHPGVDGDTIRRAFSWGYDWDGETAALCDPSLREVFTREGIGLVGVRDVQDSATGVSNSVGGRNDRRWTSE